MDKHILLTIGHSFAEFRTVADLQNAVDSGRISLEHFEGIRFNDEWDFQRYGESDIDFACRIAHMMGIQYATKK